MDYAHGWRFRGIVWLMLVVFHIQTINPMLLGYGSPHGFFIRQHETNTASIWERLLDLVVPSARAQAVDPLLASTPEFDLSDPLLVEKANELGMDPAQIFAFVRDEIAFESYQGSLRGARGTLWSKAGNALDQASLLIALLRVSNIPAQYVSGTLPDDLARELILSMFPAPLRVVGCLDPGTQLTDPANDPKLLEETREHYWVQFNTGGGFQDADPIFAGAQVGQTFTAAQGTFTEVPDNLRHKVTIRLKRELTFPQSLFGGSSQDVATVLNETFNTFELVGKPLSIGHFVHIKFIGALIFSSKTFTYSPYLLINQGDGNVVNDPIIRGTDYQEVLTNFPFGSQVLTGLFLNVTTLYPVVNGTRRTETVEKNLFDRIGFAARQTGDNSLIDLSGDTLPAILESDIVTLMVSTSKQSAQPLQASIATFGPLTNELDASIAALNATSDPELHQQAFQNVGSLSTQVLMLAAADLGGRFLFNSDRFADVVGNSILTRSYFDSARLVAVSSTLDFDPVSNSGSNKIEIDILRNNPRSHAAPQQAQIGPQALRFIKGLFDSIIEGRLLQDFEQTIQVESTSSFGIFFKALDSGAGLRHFGSTNLEQLSSVNFSAEAKARITQAILVGQLVVAPDAMVDVDGKSTIAWIEFDPVSGNSIFVSENGSHAGIVEFGSIEVTEGEGAEAQVVIAEDAQARTLGFLAAQAVARVNFLAAVAAANGTGLVLIPGPVKLAIAEVTRVQLLAGSGLSGAFAASFQAGVDLGLDVFIKTDPPVGNLLVDTGPSEDFANLGAGSGAGVAAGIIPDPLFSVALGGALVPTVFKIGIKNLTSSTDTFALDSSNVPSGFTAQTSVPQITIPPGETAEVGICLRPAAGLPVPGTNASFNVKVTSVSNSAITASGNKPFTVPEVHGVTFVSNPPALSSTPGTPVSTTLTLQAVGNMPENVTLNATLPSGLTASGLSPLSLGVGETATQTLTLTPSANTPLNSTLTATINATFGPAAAQQTATAPVSLLVRSAETVAIEQAALAAGQAENIQLAANLAALGQALAQLQANPTDPALCARVQFALDNTNLLLQANPNLAQFVPRLQDIRTAASTCDVAGLLALAPSFFADLSTVLAQQASQRFTLSLSPTSANLQPGEGKEFTVQLENKGTEVIPLTLAVAALPSGVTANLVQTQVTLAVNEVRLVPLTLSQTLVSTKVFSLQVTAAAPAVQQTASAYVAVRAALADVVSVTADPAAVNAGQPVAVSARILNSANATRSVLAHIDVLDQMGMVLASPANIAVNLVPGTEPITVNLGSVATTGLADGLYNLRVSLLATDQTPLPGRSGQTPFFLGLPVSASIMAEPVVVPPGTSTVTTKVSVTSTSSTSGIPVEGDLIAAIPGVTANASSSFSGFVPSRAIDGNLSTSWFTAGGDAANLGQSPFFEVLFPVDVTVNTLQMFGNRELANGFDFFAGAFQLFDANGAVLFDSGVVSLPAADRDVTVPIPTVAQVRRVRFTATADESSNPGFAELNVIGSALVKIEDVSAVPVGPIRLTAISTGFNGIVGIDHHEPTNKVIVSVNYSSGQPHNFELVAADGSHTQFSNISGFTDEVKIATARDDGGGQSLGGFLPGELFVGTGVGGHIARISPDGTVVQNPWVVLPGETGLMRGSLHVDRTGVFGGDLIVVTTAGGVWRVNSSGVPTRLASLGTHLEGLTTVPNNPAKYGPWAGKILAGAEQQGRIYTIDSSGNTAFFELGINPEDIDIIPANANFFGVDFASSTLRGATALQFANMVGDILVSQEFPGILWNVRWTGTQFQVTEIARVSQWEHVTFSPAGIVEVPPLAQVFVDIHHQLPASGYILNPASITPAAASVSATEVQWTQQRVGDQPAAFQLTGQVPNMTPGETRQISLGTDVIATVTIGNAAPIPITIPLPPLVVAAAHIIDLDPFSQTVERGDATTYSVLLTNPLPTPETFTLSTIGLEGLGVTLASSVPVPSGQTVSTPLMLSVPAGANEGTRTFSVQARITSGGLDAVEGQLIIAGGDPGDGPPPTVDLDTLAVDVALMPPLATAGQGTPAIYTVRVTNVGDAVDTYALSGAFPTGFTTTFAEPTVTVPPGLSNFREVLLTLTPPPGTSAGDFTFTVTAISTTKAAISDEANGTVTVVANGVDVTISPSSGAPETAFQMTVKNTGRAQDTFDLTVAGPAGLVATLTADNVSLAAGASQTLLVTVGAINFATPGTLELTATATSRANSAVRDSATAQVLIPASKGITASFDPATVTLTQPGAGNFLLRVQNTGNSEDAYAATITGTSGPVTASLNGLDGQPAQSIPTFRLPGLATGALTLTANLAAVGTGTVTVTVVSQSDSDIRGAAVATLQAASPGATAEQIPTLSSALVLLAAMLLLGGAIGLRRRRR